MGDSEALARNAVEKIALDRFVGREGDRVDDTLDSLPPLANLLEAVGNLRIVGDIDLIHHIAAKFGSEFLQTFLKSFALIGEGELRPLAMTGLGDAIGNRTVGQKTGDKNTLAGKKAHADSSINPQTRGGL